MEHDLEESKKAHSISRMNERIARKSYSDHSIHNVMGGVVNLHQLLLAR